MATSSSTTKPVRYVLLLGLLIVVVAAGLVISLGGGDRSQRPDGRWEVVASTGDIAADPIRLLPTQIGSEIEFQKRGDLAVTYGDPGLGTLRYVFSDETHLRIESSTGIQELFEYSLDGDTLALTAGSTALMLKPFKELELTVANLAGAWVMPGNAEGETADYVRLSGMLSDVLSAALGGDGEQQPERCLVTGRGQHSVLDGASYSPTQIDFASDSTLVLHDRFGSQWRGTFAIGDNSLSVEADRSSQVSANSSVAQLRGICQVVRLTNARLILDSHDNSIQIEYVRSTPSAAPTTVADPAPVAEVLTPSIDSIQGYWMLGAGGNGGLVLEKDGTAQIAGWGLGGSGLGMYMYPATYRLEDDMLFIMINEGADPPPSIVDMRFVIVGVTKDTLVLSGGQAMNVFNSAPPLLFRRPNR